MDERRNLFKNVKQVRLTFALALLGNKTICFFVIMWILWSMNVWSELQSFKELFLNDFGKVCENISSAHYAVDLVWGGRKIVKKVINTDTKTAGLWSSDEKARLNSCCKLVALWAFDGHCWENQLFRQKKQSIDDDDDDDDWRQPPAIPM